MSTYLGGLITKTLNEPTALSASGVWTLDQAIPYIKNQIWPGTGRFIYNWGNNNSGALGLGDSAITGSRTPIQVSPDLGATVTPVLSGYMQVRADGTLWTSGGYNGNGELGTNDILNKSSPVQIGTLNTWRYVANGTNGGASYAIKSDGTLWAWGWGNAGRLGDGTTVNKSSPIQIGTMTNWSRIDAGGGLALAQKTDGTLWSWGSNNYGQLGDSTTIDKSSPIQIGTLSDWASFSVGNVNGYAVKQNGTLWSWGFNNSGELGNFTDGLTTYTSSPIQVGTLTNWSSVYAARDSQAAWALRTDNTLWAWGNNGSGYTLGVQSMSFNASSPMQIDGSWGYVFPGRNGAMALKSDSTLWGWGNNTYGELNNGTTAAQISPIQVGALQYSGTPVTYNLNWSGANFLGDNWLIYNRAGTYYIMGRNRYGELGDGTTTQRTRPMLSGSLGQFGEWSSAVGINTSITKNNGSLWGWGLNDQGQLGNGNKLSTGSPTQIGTLTNWLKVSVGANTTAAIKRGRTLWVWGYNANSQVGDGTTISKSSPVQIGTVIEWADVSMGLLSAAALRLDGSLWTWGSGASGQLGQGNTISINAPNQLGTAVWKQVSAGANLMGAVRNQGTLWMWGQNTTGGLGDGTTFSRSSPVQIGALTDWVKVLCSDRFAFALKSNGSIWGWGLNTYGTLGDSTTVNKSSPVQISSSGWVDIGIGYNNCYAVKYDGTLWGWGDGALSAGGAVGDGLSTSRSSPVQIGTLTSWGYVTGGDQWASALTTKGNFYGWGDNTYEQLGQNVNTDTLGHMSSPSQIGTLSTWSKIFNYATGGGMAIKGDGTLWAWGTNSNGRLGQNDTFARSSPVQVTDYSGTYNNWSTIVSTGTSGGIKTTGTLWMWGENFYGTVGNNTTTYYSEPIMIGALSNWSQIGGGGGAINALKTDGTLWGWGRNEFGGSIGDNTIINKSSPVQIGTMTNWSKISSGGGAFFQMQAIKTDGTLWSWGNNALYGAVGDNTTINRSSPVQIGTLTNWSKVYAGSGVSLAIKTDGTLWAWGENAKGQCGDGTTIRRSSPVQIGTLTTWTDIADSLALKSDGTIWSWGDNSQGAVGDGTTINRSSPVQLGVGVKWKTLGTGRAAITSVV